MIKNKQSLKLICGALLVDIGICMIGDFCNYYGFKRCQRFIRNECPNEYDVICERIHNH